MKKRMTALEVIMISETDKEYLILQVGDLWSPRERLQMYAVPADTSIKEGDYVVVRSCGSKPRWCSRSDGGSPRRWEDMPVLELADTDFNGMTQLEIDVREYGVVDLLDVYGEESPAPSVWIFKEEHLLGELVTRILDEDTRLELARSGYRFGHHPSQCWQDCLSFINYPNNNK